MNTLHALEAFDRMLTDGVRACRQYQGRAYVDFPRVMNYAALGRERELNAIVDSVKLRMPDRSVSPEFLLPWAVHELRVHGHPAAATRLATRIVAWHDSTTSSQGFHRPWARAVALLAAREWKRAARVLDSTSATDSSVQIAGARAFAHAMAGDTAVARGILARLELRRDAFSDGTSRGSAATLMALGDTVRAVSDLSGALAGASHGDLFHYRPVALYEFLHGYAAFDALIKPVR